MWNDFLFSLWFFLPAGIANVTPIVVTKLPGLKHWNTPIDCGLSFRGKQVFGANKTWRGLVCGIVAAELIFLLERRFTPQTGGFAVVLHSISFGELSVWLGALLGFGVIAGDSIESFFKRQQSIDPGSSWFPFDQLDYIIGGCLAAAIVVVLPLRLYVWIFFIWFAMHLLFSYIGYITHFKAKPI